MRLKILIVLLIFLNCLILHGQVKIRLFSNQSPESAVFSVTKGSYEINLYDGNILSVTVNDPVLMTKYNGKVVLKKRNTNGYICDSLIISGTTGDDYFSLRLNGGSSARQFYSGDLQCFPDMETLVMINICGIEKYIAGVVMAEGGTGRNLEYFKSQAIIARTYMYKYLDKHISDRYNVCDNTHCQAFNGISSDSLLTKAALETDGLVILDKDSSLIVAAFHANCGGETASSADVWLSGQPYLKRVKDPYCVNSRSATWQKKISVKEWEDYLQMSGYNRKTSDPSSLNFVQESRLVSYKTGSFTMPLSTMRFNLNLRSTFFSVSATADSMVLNGRGYGHGVGLCQEGAMVMASRGFTYMEIINFYYSGVIISDIKNALALQ